MNYQNYQNKDCKASTKVNKKWQSIGTAIRSVTNAILSKGKKKLKMLGEYESYLKKRSKKNIKKIKLRKDDKSTIKLRNQEINRI